GNEGADAQLDVADIVLRSAAGQEAALVVMRIGDEEPAAAAIERLVDAAVPGKVSYTADKEIGADGRENVVGIQRIHGQIAVVIEGREGGREPDTGWAI